MLVRKAGTWANTWPSLASAWLPRLLLIAAVFAHAEQVSGSYCPPRFPADFQCDVCEADGDCKVGSKSGVCTSDMVVQPLSQSMAWSCNATGAEGLVPDTIPGIYLSCAVPEATCFNRVPVLEDMAACTLTNCTFAPDEARGVCSKSRCACNPGPCKDAVVEGLLSSSGGFDWECGAPGSCSFTLDGMPLMPLRGQCTAGQCVGSGAVSPAGGGSGGGGQGVSPAGSSPPSVSPEGSSPGAVSPAGSSSGGGSSTGAVVGGVVGGVVGLLVLVGLLVGWRRRRAGGQSKLLEGAGRWQKGGSGNGGKTQLEAGLGDWGAPLEGEGLQMEAGCEKGFKDWELAQSTVSPALPKEQVNVVGPTTLEPSPWQGLHVKDWLGSGGLWLEMGRESSTTPSTEPGVLESTDSLSHLGPGAKQRQEDRQVQLGNSRPPPPHSSADGAARNGDERDSVLQLLEDEELRLAIRAAEVAKGEGGDPSAGIDIKTWTIEFEDLNLEAKIGEGSYGRVYLAKWQQTLVEVKVLLNTGVDVHSPQALQQAVTLSSPVLANLRKEAGLMAALRHPNVVGFLGVCSVPPCVITEYCANGSLTRVLQAAKVSAEAAKKLHWHRRLSMMLDTARGMLYLHSLKAPIVHRDLKSPNLLVDGHWRVKVSDFNLSRILGDAAALSSAHANNPRWQAPEVLQGESATLLSDVYSFGVVMWEMLTWEVPFATDNQWQVVRYVGEGGRLPVPPPDQLPGRDTLQFSGLDAYIQLMRRCWAQAPEDRPNFTQIIDALRVLAEQRAPDPTPDQEELAHLEIVQASTAGPPPSPWASPVSHVVPLPAAGSNSSGLPWPHSGSEASTITQQAQSQSTQ